MKSAAAAAAIAMLFVCGPAGCLLPGSETLTTSSNVELVVTGVEAGDRVRVDIAGSTFTSVGGRIATVHFFFTVASGEQVGRLTIARRNTSLCASFSVDAPASPARVTTSVSAADSETCPEDPGDVDAGPSDGDSDAGPPARELVSISEITVAACGQPECTTRTVVTGDGVASVEDGTAAPATGVASAQNRAQLDELALSAGADALFAGEDPSCPRPGLPAGDAVTLERTTRTGDTAATESVDASGCDGGVVSPLRALLASIRAEVFAP